MAITSAKITCRLISELLTAHKVNEVVISPGSRNTPIILALDGNNLINKHIIIDERSAGFVALGMAKASKSPVALVCTSGTALLNYAPAVAEAYYHSIPLIVISADRPIQWIDQDDSQTIRQFEALNNFVKKSYDLPDIDESDDEMIWYANRIINDAMLTAISGRKGPVHINLQLNQPLSHTVNVSKFGQERVIKTIPITTQIDDSIIANIASEICTKNVLIIGGFFEYSQPLRDTLIKISHYPNIKILTETISNVSGGCINSSIDRTISSLNENELKELYPDVVISFGGALVSRYVKQFLRTAKPERHISIGHNHTTIDCFKSLTDRAEISPEKFFNQLLRAIEKTSEVKETVQNEYALKWKQIEQREVASHEKFLSKIGWCDLKAFEIISANKQINSGKRFHLSVSNGTPIRYTQLFDYFGDIEFSCNRGVSGIDGCTSTAIGIAIINARKQIPTLFISGDMSFCYDIGALSIPSIPDSIKIIVINNAGGGIFRFIPSTKNLEQREKYFACNPHTPIRQLAEAYSFNYFKASNEYELNSILDAFLETEQKSILEIETPAEASAEILTQYMNRKH